MGSATGCRPKLPGMKKSIEVVGAVIVSSGEVLCAQRGPNGPLSGLWEFPGGKVEAGESRRQALAREITEELDCGIEVGDRITTTRHDYDFAVITLTTFWCVLTRGMPAQSEHSALLWVPPEELASLDWAPADVPAVDLVRRARELL